MNKLSSTVNKNKSKTTTLKKSTKMKVKSWVKSTVKENGDYGGVIPSNSSKLNTMQLSRKSVEKALSVLSGDTLAVNSLLVRQKDRIPCTKMESPDSSVMALNNIMEHVRLAMLYHDWEEVKLTLPKLFGKKFTQQYIWKTVLQVICHHPGSSEELLQDQLQTRLQTTHISESKLRKIFCVPVPMDIESVEETATDDEQFVVNEDNQGSIENNTESDVQQSDKQISRKKGKKKGGQGPNSKAK